MSTEAEKILLQDEFEELIASGNEQRIHDFLDEQNISDVADLIYENEDQDAYILSQLSIHRAIGGSNIKSFFSKSFLKLVYIVP
jgi:magnesium transporter